ncbi:hypothetical protein FHR81_002881 [Actinoalloteichus hoggarensis]|uniref:Outer membrane channel protein CpnT-like N-terminal domain-containing protein n=1 Tax=Actinoalloteichus hoggarensis TaxID=1470176 RepID=A0A221VY84_9PSEU|nr:hypothetical protein [Actinoalloteichus hoggarensis]ASO18473.1 hypothetical protein AHOG_04085 [Actinoalloteichus hoggarensis]MBB5921841.1 hypothetical protein [Actinoalloteichus hoggarensis]
MGMEIPDEVKWLIPICVGMNWPEGDETALRRLGEAWRQAAADVGAVIEEGQAAADASLNCMEGQTADAFRQMWDQFVAGDERFLVSLQEFCEELGANCDATALEVEYTKYMIIASLIMLLIQILAMIAAAFATFGAASAGIPVAQAATRLTVQMIFRQLIISILKSVALEVAMSVGLDAAVQGLQMLQGNRESMDWGKIKDSAISGVISGVVGGVSGVIPTGATTGLSTSVTGSLTDGALRGATRGAAEGLVSTAAEGLITGQGITAQDLLYGTTSGAVGGAVDGTEQRADSINAPSPDLGGADSSNDGLGPDGDGSIDLLPDRGGSDGPSPADGGGDSGPGPNSGPSDPGAPGGGSPGPNALATAPGGTGLGDGTGGPGTAPSTIGPGPSTTGPNTPEPGTTGPGAAPGPSAGDGGPVGPPADSGSSPAGSPSNPPAAAGSTAASGSGSSHTPSAPDAPRTPDASSTPDAAPDTPAWNGGPPDGPGPGVDSSATVPPAGTPTSPQSDVPPAGSSSPDSPAAPAPAAPTTNPDSGASPGGAAPDDGTGASPGSAATGEVPSGDSPGGSAPSGGPSSPSAGLDRTAPTGGGGADGPPPGARSAGTSGPTSTPDTFGSIDPARGDSVAPRADSPADASTADRGAGTGLPPGGSMTGSTPTSGPRLEPALPPGAGALGPQPPTPGGLPPGGFGPGSADPGGAGAGPAGFGPAGTGPTNAPSGPTQGSDSTGPSVFGPGGPGGPTRPDSAAPSGPATITASSMTGGTDAPFTGGPAGLHGGTGGQPGGTGPAPSGGSAGGPAAGGMPGSVPFGPTGGGFSSPQGPGPGMSGPTTSSPGGQSGPPQGGRQPNPGGLGAPPPGPGQPGSSTAPRTAPTQPPRPLDAGPPPYQSGPAQQHPGGPPRQHPGSSPPNPGGRPPQPPGGPTPQRPGGPPPQHPHGATLPALAPPPGGPPGHRPTVPPLPPGPGGPGMPGGRQPGPYQGGPPHGGPQRPIGPPGAYGPGRPPGGPSPGGAPHPGPNGPAPSNDQSPRRQPGVPGHLGPGAPPPGAMGGPSDGFHKQPDGAGRQPDGPGRQSGGVGRPAGPGRPPNGLGLPPHMPNRFGPPPTHPTGPDRPGPTGPNPSGPGPHQQPGPSAPQSPPTGGPARPGADAPTRQPGDGDVPAPRGETPPAGTGPRPAPLPRGIGGIDGGPPPNRASAEPPATQALPPAPAPRTPEDAGVPSDPAPDAPTGPEDPTPRHEPADSATAADSSGATSSPEAAGSPDAVDSPDAAGSDVDRGLSPSEHEYPLSDGSTYDTSLGADQLDSAGGFESELAERLEGTGLTPEQFDELRQRPVENYTAEEVAAIRDVRDGVEAPAGEVVQRVLTSEVAANYLRNNPVFIPDGSGGRLQIFDPTKANGFTTRYRDVAELRGPADVIEGLRLDYTDLGYEERNGRPPYLPDDASIPVLRFPLDQPDNLTIPYGGTTPEGQMIMGGDARQDPPFTGNGFPGSEHHAIPEFQLSPTEFGEIAELWVVDREGDERLLAAFDPDSGQWSTTPHGEAWLSANDTARADLLAERDAASTTPTTDVDPADGATRRRETASSPDSTSPAEPADRAGDRDGPPDGADGSVETPSPAPDPAALLAASATTPAGRAFFPDEPETSRSAMDVAPDPDGRRTYDLHGDRQHVFIGDQTLTAAEFADVVRADPDWNGEAIRLLSCDTGGLPDGFAAQLARELGVEVLAPTEMGWVGADGSVFSAEGVQNADGDRIPTDPPGGRWDTFHPDGTSAEFGEGGPYLSDAPADPAAPEDARPRANTRSSDQVADYLAPPRDPDVPPVPVLLAPGQRFGDVVPDPDPNTWYRAEIQFEDADGDLRTRPLGDFFVGSDEAGPARLEYVSSTVPNEGLGTDSQAYFPPGDATGPVLGALGLVLDPGVVYDVIDGYGRQRFRTDDLAEPPRAVTWDGETTPSGDAPEGTERSTDDTTPEPSSTPVTTRTEEWNPREGAFTVEWADRAPEDRPANAEITLLQPDGSWHATIYTDGAGNISRVHTWAGPVDGLYNPELGNKSTMHFHHDETKADPHLKNREGAPIGNVVFGVIKPPEAGETPGEPRWLFHTDERGYTSAASGKLDFDKLSQHARYKIVQQILGHVGTDNEYKGLGLFFQGGHIFGHAAGGINERIALIPQWRKQNATFGRFLTADGWGEMENDLRETPDITVDAFDFWADRADGKETPTVIHIRFQITMGDPPVTSTHLRSFPNVPSATPLAP